MLTAFCFVLFWGSVLLKCPGCPRCTIYKLASNLRQFSCLSLQRTAITGMSHCTGLDLCFLLVVILQEYRRMFCLPENTIVLPKSCTHVPRSQVTGLFSNNLVKHTDLNSKFETVSPNKHKAITQAAVQWDSNHEGLFTLCLLHSQVF